ncbi:MAG: D-glycero-beta-D-manno-heptose 1-phosphate adenylyltransferase [Bacteroidia bacterium]|nr:D-glycero-beta-D-manno-heptose 1-phosphate adenylyltransferase [Bacteroidia bacterium]
MKLHHNTLTAKICTWDKLRETIDSWRQNGETIVFTNGCFDLLHKGHVDYLNKAADLGDHLVIGLNSDESVSRLKGAHRPLQDESSREYLLAALQCVSLVTVFEQDTPENLIQLVQPDILVKGGDYTRDTVVGADYVEELGGRIEIIPFLPGYSTSSIEQKIRKSTNNL